MPEWNSDTTTRTENHPAVLSLVSLKFAQVAPWPVRCVVPSPQLPPSLLGKNKNVACHWPLWFGPKKVLKHIDSCWLFLGSNCWNRVLDVEKTRPLGFLTDAAFGPNLWTWSEWIAEFMTVSKSFFRIPGWILNPDPHSENFYWITDQLLHVLSNWNQRLDVSTWYSDEFLLPLVWPRIWWKLEL